MFAVRTPRLVLVAAAVAALLTPSVAAGATLDGTLQVTRSGKVSTLRCVGVKATGTGLFASTAKATAACQAARKGFTTLQGSVPGERCMQVYSGPNRARVTGLFGGAVIDRVLQTNNSCATRDWDRLAALVGARSGSGPVRQS